MPIKRNETKRAHFKPSNKLFSRSKNHLRRSRCIENGNVTREKLPHGIMGRVHNPPLSWPYYYYAALTQRTAALETSQPWWHCKEIDCYIFRLHQECLSASKPLCQQTRASLKGISFLPVSPIYEDLAVTAFDLVYCSLCVLGDLNMQEIGLTVDG